MRIFVPAGGQAQERAVEQLRTCLADERAVAGALMADHHVGYSMPVGGVVAYDGAISPTGVGFDIACGNKAVRTEIEVSPDVRAEIPRLCEEIRSRVAFGLGRKAAVRVDHELFDDDAWTWIERELPGLKEKAAAQLGTVGSGNHYVDLLVDEDGFLWAACHFGSRGLGHTLASGFLAVAAGRRFADRVPERERPVVLDVSTETGGRYVEAMRLAGRYAYAGRDAVVDQVLAILGRPAVTESVHCHHNYAWLEDGLWVVLKGATPLTSKPAFVGGSMGDISVVVRGTREDVGALGSAPHGAGRVLSRTQAAGRWRRETVTRVDRAGRTFTKTVRVRDTSTAAIDWPAVQRQLAARGITVLGSGADEAPGVYKPLRDVLAAHANVEVVHTLEPVGVVMAGDDELDPYRD